MHRVRIIPRSRSDAKIKPEACRDQCSVPERKSHHVSGRGYTCSKETFQARVGRSFAC